MLLKPRACWSKTAQARGGRDRGPEKPRKAERPPCSPRRVRVSLDIPCLPLAHSALCPCPHPPSRVVTIPLGGFTLQKRALGGTRHLVQLLRAPRSCTNAPVGSVSQANCLSFPALPTTDQGGAMEVPSELRIISTSTTCGIPTKTAQDTWWSRIMGWVTTCECLSHAGHPCVLGSVTIRGASLGSWFPKTTPVVSIKT